MMKKEVILVFSLVSLLCLSLSVSSLNNQTQFNTSQSSALIDFSSNNHNQNVYVNLVQHAYVTSTNLTLTGLISEWETLDYYNISLNQPFSGEYVDAQTWLISDIGGSDNVKLVNVSSDSVLATCPFNDPYDADYVGGNWLVAARGENTVYLVNKSCSVLNHYNVTTPEAVEYVNSTHWLISSQGIANEVILANVGSGPSAYPANVDLSYDVSTPYDIEFVASDNTWLIARNSQIIKVNVPAMTVNRIQPFSGIIFDVESINNDAAWLYINRDNKEIILFNTTDNSTINFYNSSLSSPRDVKYISENEWLITDETGAKKVSFEKKYYPTNLQMSVGGSAIDSWSGSFNATQTVTNFTDAVNNFLLGCSTAMCNLPFNFVSSTSGKLNLSLLNITYNRMPSVDILAPTAGLGWTGLQNFTWNMTDDDNDLLSARTQFWNGTDLISVNATDALPGIYNFSFDTTLYADGANYYFTIIVNDSYNNDTDNSGNFTIDNTNPLIWNLRINDSDDITRSDAVLAFRVEANDFSLQTVVLNSSSMALESGTTYLNSTTANSLGCPISAANSSCTLTATVTDIANRQNSTDLVIIIDDVSPAISDLTSNATSNQSYNTESLNFTVNATDINLRSVTLNGSAMTHNNGLWTLTAQPSTLGCSAGTVCGLTATAVDYADNTNFTQYNLTIKTVFSSSSSNSGGSSKDQCEDGKDNDGDGLTDYPNDPGCINKDDNDETNTKGSSCEEKWTCADWNTCTSGKQTRICHDANNCGSDFFKPETEQTCTMPSSTVAPEETYEVEPSAPPGLGQAIGLFDRLKANWYYILGAAMILAALAYLGWHNQKKKRGKKSGSGAIFQD